jgi:TolB-like protein/class 3 adenylate cyclase/Tfp pilus assembly protein PilF
MSADRKPRQGEVNGIVSDDKSPAAGKPLPELTLEIAYLLLIDLVGYSRLLVNEQIEQMQELNQIVRSTECFQAAEKNKRLVRVPTGDGMALLFFRSPEEPVRCALEIQQALKEHPNIQLRMGIHSGPVNQVTDVNDQVNMAGSGINVGQRVLDCGDSGHILLSKHLADDLAQYRHWQPYLQDLGECEVKHGLRLHIFNLYKEGLGNPALPEKLKRRKMWKQTSGTTVRPISAPRWPKSVLLVAMLLSAVALAVSFTTFFHRASPMIRNLSESGAPIPEKSIAVLPFENLSEEKQNAHFTDGVQDEILTDLAKVADLKVISRTSVMQYKSGAERNLRDIAKALGVSHVVEGSVQRVGGRVRVSAQLIDAKTDAHVWAEHYDRDIADVFAIQSELAEQIVSQLKARLSPQEKAAIEQKPTGDLAAHDLYIHAKTLIQTAVLNTPQNESLFDAVKLLNEAIQRDPAFALAYYQLAHAHDLLYFLGADHTSARLAMANEAIQAVARLRPDSGEAHLAHAKHFYWGYLDYDRARAELELAKKSLSNDPLPFLLAGYIDRRQGRWDESTKNIERAIELDPQNANILTQIANSYEHLRRYVDAEKALDRAIVITPKDPATRAFRAAVELDWHADPRPSVSTIKEILAEDPGAAENLSEQLLNASLCQRDVEGAQRALAALPVAGCYRETIPFPRAWCEGLVAQIRGDKAAARAAFTATRNETVKLLREQPNYAEALCVLGMADALLGNKKEAIREGRRAVELLPATKDSIGGSLLIQYLAFIYAWTGEKDHAFEQLAIAARIPGPLHYGQLRLHPYWDPLRGDPRFDKIVASLAPK